jgi:hypothetical protein
MTHKTTYSIPTKISISTEIKLGHINIGAVRFSGTPERTHYTARCKTPISTENIKSSFKARYCLSANTVCLLYIKWILMFRRKLQVDLIKKRTRKINCGWNVEMLTTVQEVHIFTKVQWRNLDLRCCRLETPTRPHFVIIQKGKIFYDAMSQEDTASVVLRPV